MILFIYGTLKRGYPAHDLMIGAEFLGEALTEPSFQLYSEGWYPMMVTDPTGIAIEGEVWEVPENMVQKLDHYEGSEYQRVAIQLQSLHAEKLAVAYLYKGRVTGRKAIGPRWENE